MKDHESLNVTREYLAELYAKAERLRLLERDVFGLHPEECDPPTVESVTREIERIVNARQELRYALEVNRKLLIDAQAKLSRLLIARYLS